LIPVLIVGTKYDVLSEMDNERRNLLCKTLRFVAHTNGASLTFISSKDDTTLVKCRHILSHFAFKTNLTKVTLIDHTKPISIIAGILNFYIIRSRYHFSNWTAAI
jgi:dynein light intermediate chain 2